MIAEEDEMKYQIALSLIDGVGDVIGKKLLAYCGSAKAVFLTPKDKLATVSGVGRVLLDSIINTDVLKRAEKEVLFIKKEEIKHLFYGDKKYPNRLKQSEKGYPAYKTKQAILLESAADVIKGLNWDVKEKDMQQTMFIELRESEQKIIDLLSINQLHIDTIVEKLGWNFSKVANELLQAEFKGLILSLPGKIYKKNI